MKNKEDGNISSKHHLSRRRFFKWSLGALVGIISLSWIDMFKKIGQLEVPRMKTIAFDQIGNGVHFFDEVILIVEDGNPRVFSAVCPHMSCFINNFSDNKLICPCHGSAFDLNGSPLKGPAPKSLSPLEFQHEGSNLIIQLEA